VEDDEAILNLVGFHLRLADFAFTAVSDGREALRVAQDRLFDLIVLDIVLPGMDGLTVCQAIRHDSPNSEVPILMLTARTEESDRVLGLESGADDYLTKPFGVRELIARLRALMRRPRSTWRSVTRGQATSHLGVTIDPTRRRVTVDGGAVALTPQEFGLLHLLVSHPGIVFTREELIKRVWQGEVFITPRGVDTLIKRLRRKVERDPAQPTRILTTRGAGYKFGES
jgi:DNA-binding response OmpR family regulator